VGPWLRSHSVHTVHQEVATALEVCPLGTWGSRAPWCPHPCVRVVEPRVGATGTQVLTRWPRVPRAALFQATTALQGAATYGPTWAGAVPSQGATPLFTTAAFVASVVCGTAVLRGEEPVPGRVVGPAAESIWRWWAAKVGIPQSRPGYGRRWWRTRGGPFGGGAGASSVLRPAAAPLTDGVLAASVLSAAVSILGPVWHLAWKVGTVCDLKQGCMESEQASCATPEVVSVLRVFAAAGLEACESHRLQAKAKIGSGAGAEAEAGAGAGAEAGAEAEAGYILPRLLQCLVDFGLKAGTLGFPAELDTTCAQDGTCDQGTQDAEDAAWAEPVNGSYTHGSWDWLCHTWVWPPEEGAFVATRARLVAEVLRAVSTLDGDPAAALKVQRQVLLGDVEYVSTWLNDPACVPIARGEWWSWKPRPMAPLPAWKGRWPTTHHQALLPEFFVAIMGTLEVHGWSKWGPGASSDLFTSPTRFTCLSPALPLVAEHLWPVAPEESCIGMYALGVHTVAPLKGLDPATLLPLAVIPCIGATPNMDPIGPSRLWAPTHNPPFWSLAAGAGDLVTTTVTCIGTYEDLLEAALQAAHFGGSP
jgi:hypothetical protein